MASLFRKELHLLLQEEFAQLDVDLQDLLQKISTPPEFKLGQLSLPCFSFARSLKKSPKIIAEEFSEKINQKLQKGASFPSIQKCFALNGFLNFYANSLELLSASSNIEGEFLDEIKVETPQKISIEYSQPNTHKNLHVGHLRNLVLGETLSKIKEKRGHEIIRCTYPGDLGTHISKSLYYILQKKLPPADYDSAEKLGRIYVQANTLLNALSEDELIAAKKEMALILKKIKSKEGSEFELYKETREVSLAQMRKLYTWFGCHFDQWFYESECDESSMQLVQKLYQDGKLELSNGAIGLDLSADKLGFAMLIKSDGNGLYLTKDVALFYEKFKDPKLDLALYVVDSRQKLHFQQLFKLAEKIGFPQASKCQHLSYEFVCAEDGQSFSSREGNADDLLGLKEELEKTVLENYLNRYKGDWSEDEIEGSKKSIVLAALKYGMIRIDPQKPIKFAQATWLALEGDTGPYLLYALSRCNRVLEKASYKKEGSADYKLETALEEELVYQLKLLGEKCIEADNEDKASVLADYLFKSAKLFNRFYKECPMLGAEETIKRTRLEICALFQKTLSLGLDLLNIPTIKRM